MMAHDPIPFFYRLMLLYIEPFLALGGCLLLHFTPSTFLSTMSQTQPPPPATTLLSVRILTDQLAIMQLLFALQLGVLLRLAFQDDARVRIWRICCAGMLVSDALHVAASVRELEWDVVLAPGTRWRPEEWVNFGVLGIMALTRLGVVLRVGMSRCERFEIEKDAIVSSGEKRELLS